MDTHDAIAHRRSVYALSGETVVSDARIVEIVGNALYHAPSPWNGQMQRAIVLFGGRHVQLWDIVEAALLSRVAGDRADGIRAKVATFRNGRGTILWFEDRAATEALSERFPSYAEVFPVWAEQSMGMAEYAVWVSLEAEGLGVNLQHYNPIIDDQVRQEFSAPATWVLGAQMVFGHPTAWPTAKDKMPLEERLRVEGVAS